MTTQRSRRQSVTPATTEPCSGILVKTKMCRFHLLGMCSKGVSCPFAHESAEMNPKPDLYKTKLCKTLIKTGKCEDTDCTYAHNKEELRIAQLPGHRRKAPPAGRPSTRQAFTKAFDGGNTGRNRSTMMSPRALQQDDQIDVANKAGGLWQFSPAASSMPRIDAVHEEFAVATSSGSASSHKPCSPSSYRHDKTKLCKTLIKTGKCGDADCTYAHNKEELRIAELPGNRRKDLPAGRQPTCQAFTRAFDGGKTGRNRSAMMSPRALPQDDQIDVANQAGGLWQSSPAASNMPRIDAVHEEFAVATSSGSASSHKPVPLHPTGTGGREASLVGRIRAADPMHKPCSPSSYRHGWQGSLTCRSYPSSRSHGTSPQVTPRGHEEVFSVVIQTQCHSGQVATSSGDEAAAPVSAADFEQLLRSGDVAIKNTFLDFEPSTLPPDRANSKRATGFHGSEGLRAIPKPSDGSAWVRSGLQRQVRVHLQSLTYQRLHLNNPFEAAYEVAKVHHGCGLPEVLPHGTSPQVTPRGHDEVFSVVLKMQCHSGQVATKSGDEAAAVVSADADFEQLLKSGDVAIKNTFLDFEPRPRLRTVQTAGGRLDSMAEE
eukprot:CAMPEP_0172932300 /NCGR_PEP_ID=MMETSP1075-20121228/219931_1 /TAXON_ID=2916 /ORGANISM="Ceratium fusus, Strain PA161109" /LENGTH=600 /DNA_ID=CAMNT_0013793627 /DNA_START=42 /DNA_END=1845 /DNA_ORIENTATION=+